MPPIFSTFIRYGSRSSSTTTQLPTEFLAFFSLISSPCGARPGTGLAEPAERPRRERSDRSGLGAVRRVTAQQAPAAAEADRLRAAGAWSKTAHGAALWACLWVAPVRGGVRWLAEQERRLQAARRASDLGASRLLMQDALAGARTPEVAIAGVAAFPCIYARAWMPVTRIAAWAVGVWDGRLT